MSVLKLGKDFYFYIKETRDTKKWKEEYWRFEKFNSSVRFGHKENFLTLNISVWYDKRTYIIHEQGRRKLTEDDWNWFFTLIKKNEHDVLFLFKDDENRNNNFLKCVSTGPQSHKIKELYDELLLYRNGREVKYHTEFFEVGIKKRIYPVKTSFDFEEGTITLRDETRRLNKTFFNTQDLRKYAKK